MNHRIDNIPKKALRLVFKDHNSSFDDLLLKGNSYRIHHGNVQKLAF